MELKLQRRAWLKRKALHQPKRLLHARMVHTRARLQLRSRMSVHVFHLPLTVTLLNTMQHPQLPHHVRIHLVLVALRLFRFQWMS